MPEDPAQNIAQTGVAEEQKPTSLQDATHWLMQHFIRTEIIDIKEGTVDRTAAEAELLDLFGEKPKD